MSRCMLPQMLLIIVILCVHFCLYSCVVEVSWDFNQNEGWASDLTTKESNIEVSIVNNELRGKIIGFNPIIDSPSLFMSISRRNYCIIRMAYTGAATSARLLLLSSSTSIASILQQNTSSSANIASTLNVNHDLNYINKKSWDDAVVAVPISSSSTVLNADEQHSIDKLTDSSLETYYLSNFSASSTANSTLSSNQIILTFDLLKPQLISSLTIYAVYGKVPKRCMLLKSTSNSDGDDGSPGSFITVKSFVVQNIVTTTTINNSTINNTSTSKFDFTTVTGFTGYSRYWQLIILDVWNTTTTTSDNNNDNAQIGLREVIFQGTSNRVAVIPFTIQNTGKYRIYYIPMYTATPSMFTHHPLINIRLEITHTSSSSTNNSGAKKQGSAPLVREAMAIDYIRITRSPLIWRVRSPDCVNIYYDRVSVQSSSSSSSSSSSVDSSSINDYSIFKTTSQNSSTGAVLNNIDINNYIDNDSSSSTNSIASVRSDTLIHTGNNLVLDTEKYDNISFNITSRIELINGERPLQYYTQQGFERFFLETDVQSPYKYAAALDCPLFSSDVDDSNSNNDDSSDYSDGSSASRTAYISIDGIDFGQHPPNVYIDGVQCPVKSHTHASTGSRVSTVICSLPSLTGAVRSGGINTGKKSSGDDDKESVVVQLTRGGLVTVKVEDSTHSGLYYESKLLAYRMPPPQPLPLFIYHIRSHAVDASWIPPDANNGDNDNKKNKKNRLLDGLVTTGYKIKWRQLIEVLPPAYTDNYNISNSINSNNTTQVIVTSIPTAADGITKYYTPIVSSISSSTYSYMAVGNISFTSIRGLQSNTAYQFAIAGVAEGGAAAAGNNINSNNNYGHYPYATDQYGRRALTAEALVGQYSEWSPVVVTTPYDLLMTGSERYVNGEGLLCNGTINNNTNTTSTNNSINSTNSSTSSSPYLLDPFVLLGFNNNTNTVYRQSILLDGVRMIRSNNIRPPLQLIGSASYIPLTLIAITNSNTSSIVSPSSSSVATIDPLIIDFLQSADKKTIPNVLETQTLIYNCSFNNTNIVSNTTNTNATNSANMTNHHHHHHHYDILRLTPSAAQQRGAAWSARKINVAEGFDTTFSFIISAPSVTCNVMDDANTMCRSRGADGFAFVIHNAAENNNEDDGHNIASTSSSSSSSSVPIDSAPSSLLNNINSTITAPQPPLQSLPLQLGTGGGKGLGYEGIHNGLSIEFDTYMNYDVLDAYENHVAVMTEGWRYNLTSNHSRSLATTTAVPDLTQGVHTVRIRYEPYIAQSSSALKHASFQVTGHTSWFFENADFINGGQSDWGSSGLGLLKIYIDNLDVPILTTHLNLATTLKLDRGRAVVGFTAATGDTHWQTHDILQWSFESLQLDAVYTPPLVVNEEGGYNRCGDETVCVHRPDNKHYNRQNG